MSDRFGVLKHELQRVCASSNPADYSRWFIDNSDKVLEAIDAAEERDLIRTTAAKFEETATAIMAKQEAELATLQSQLDEQNGILGEMANTPDGAIIAGLRAELEVRWNMIERLAQNPPQCSRCDSLSRHLKIAVDALESALTDLESCNDGQVDGDPMATVKLVCGYIEQKLTEIAKVPGER